ncbi:MAG TPA: membrane protein insertase YidC, partial [Parvularculaceae bacterium]|nr:membrane protein insertase YidC [Parvularculaceae bacterium]
MDRNLILAVALSALVLIGWELFINGPQREALQAQRKVVAEQAQMTASPAAEPELGVTPVATEMTVEEALAATPERVEIDTPNFKGSINLVGGRIDDLLLKQYHEELSDESPMIRLLSPANTEHGHYIQLGWAIGGKLAETVRWTAPEGAKLTPQTPVTLTRREGGLVFQKTFAVDDIFMFTVSQTVRNESDATQTLTPYGVVIQHSIPTGAGKYMILHEGPIAIAGKSLYERKYKKAVTAVVEAKGDKGWAGITNKYWLAAAIPPQGEEFNLKIRNVSKTAVPTFQVAYDLSPRTLGPGETTTLTSHIFSGAKDVDILQSYEKPVEKGGLGIWDFDRAIDWGNFFILTRPIFYTLNFFGDLTGNFGIAILLLTLVIKALMFPLANKAYESMSKMKKLQPEVQKLQERYKDDKVKLQQEMMALYQKE